MSQRYRRRTTQASSIIFIKPSPPPSVLSYQGTITQTHTSCGDYELRQRANNQESGLVQMGSTLS